MENGFPILEDAYDLASGDIYPVKDRCLRLAMDYLSKMGSKEIDARLVVSIAREFENYFYDYLDDLSKGGGEGEGEGEG